MFHWALTFLLVAMFAGAFRFFGIAGAAAEIAEVIFFVAITMFLVSLVLERRKV